MDRISDRSSSHHHLVNLEHWGNKKGNDSGFDPKHHLKSLKIPHKGRKIFLKGAIDLEILVDPLG